MRFERLPKYRKESSVKRKKMLVMLHDRPLWDFILPHLPMIIAEEDCKGIIMSQVVFLTVCCFRHNCWRVLLHFSFSHKRALWLSVSSSSSHPRHYHNKNLVLHLQDQQDQQEGRSEEKKPFVDEERPSGQRVILQTKIRITFPYSLFLVVSSSVFLSWSSRSRTRFPLKLHQQEFKVKKTLSRRSLWLSFPVWIPVLIAGVGSDLFVEEHNRLFTFSSNEEETVSSTSSNNQETKRPTRRTLSFL